MALTGSLMKPPVVAGSSTGPAPGWDEATAAGEAAGVVFDGNIWSLGGNGASGGDDARGRATGRGT